MFEEFIWLWTLLSVVGTIMNARLNKWCFAIYIIANIGWIIVDIEVGLYEQIPLWIIYIIIGAYGWITWKRNGITGDNHKQISNKKEVAFCFDTCHAFSSGYNLSTEEGYKDTFFSFQAACCPSKREKSRQSMHRKD